MEGSNIPRSPHLAAIRGGGFNWEGFEKHFNLDAGASRIVQGWIDNHFNQQELTQYTKLEGFMESPNLLTCSDNLADKLRKHYHCTSMVPKDDITNWFRQLLVKRWNEVNRPLPTDHGYIEWMTLKLRVMKGDKQIYIGEIASSQCVDPKYSIYDPKNYLLRNFYEKFEEIINRKEKAHNKSPIKMKDGQLQYMKRAPGGPYGGYGIIKTQAEFEVAIIHMSNGRTRLDDTLDFKFYIESAGEKKAREDKECLGRHPEPSLPGVLRRKPGYRTLSPTTEKPIAAIPLSEILAQSLGQQDQTLPSSSITIPSSPAVAPSSPPGAPPTEQPSFKSTRQEIQEQRPAKKSRLPRQIARITKQLHQPQYPAITVPLQRHQSQRGILINPERKEATASPSTPKTQSLQQLQSSNVPPIPKKSSQRQPATNRTNTLRQTISNIRSKPPSSKPDDNEVWKEKFKDLFKEAKVKTYTRGGDQADLAVGGFKGADDMISDDEVEAPDDEGYETKEDYLITKLQDLQNLPEFSQLRDIDQPDDNFRRWKECCRLFQRPFAEVGPDEVVHLAGLKTPLYQYQAFGVYWQMTRSREVGGGFVADEMGLGKTLTFLAYLVAERQLSCLWEEVIRSRQLKDGKHLLERESREFSACPTKDARPNWIACPCVAASPAAKMQPKLGVRLACVPSALVPTWMKQFKTHVDTEVQPLLMRLIVAHPPSIGKAGPGFAAEDSQISRNIDNLKAQRNETRAKSGLYNEDTAKFGQDKFLVVTTKEYYKTWVKKFHYAANVRDSLDPGNFVRGENPGIVFGIAINDECHEEYQKGKGRSEIMERLPKINHPFIWGYSGTPFSQTPRGLEGILWAIESHAPKKYSTLPSSGWAQDASFLHRFTYADVFSPICRDFEDHVKNETGSKEVMEDIAGRLRPFLATFMMRRTVDTSWFGHPLMKLKAHTHQDVILRHHYTLDADLAKLSAVVEEEVATKLRELQEKWDGTWPTNRKSQVRPVRLAFNTECQVQWRLRILATFPYLVKLADNNHPNHLTFTPEETARIREKENDPSKNPYAKYLQAITQCSPKCMWLYSFIVNQLDKTPDSLGREQKLVIMTFFNPVALILKLFIEKRIASKAGRVGLVTSGMKTKDRIATLESFTDALDINGKRKQKTDFQILIGTTRLIGSGLQLTRASNIILMEPDYEFFREMQGYARVHRIGQMNEMSRSWRLIDEGSVIEQRILEKQVARREWVGRRIDEEVLDEVLLEEEEEGDDEWWERNMKAFNKLGEGDAEVENEEGSGRTVRPLNIVKSQTALGKLPESQVVSGKDDSADGVGGPAEAEGRLTAPLNEDSPVLGKSNQQHSA